MLVIHRVHYMNERLIAVDQTMSAAQDVTFEPAFYGMFAEHLHDAAVWRQLAAVQIFREILTEPHLLSDFIDSLKLVGLRLVRSEDPKVFHVLPHDLAEKDPESGNVAGQRCPGLLDVHCGVA